MPCNTVIEKAPRLILVVSGGILQSVVSDDPEVFEGMNIIVVDYDGCRKSFPDTDGNLEYADVGRAGVQEVPTEWVNAILQTLD